MIFDVRQKKMGFVGTNPKLTEFMPAPVLETKLTTVDPLQEETIVVLIPAKKTYSVFILIGILVFAFISVTIIIVCSYNRSKKASKYTETLSSHPTKERHSSQVPSISQPNSELIEQYRPEEGKHSPPPSITLDIATKFSPLAVHDPPPEPLPQQLTQDTHREMKTDAHLATF